MMKTKILVIGAGPAGLALAARLHKAGEAYTLLEQATQIAHRWHGHYERLHLHTEKSISHLPFEPFAQDVPRYVPREQLITYYQAYAKTYNIKPRFNQQVKHIHKTAQGWQVETQDSHYETKKVVIATGFNNKPHIPQWQGQENYQAEISHSRDFKRGADFKGQRVLVVGMGNTGAEIALDLVESGAEASISVRGPVNIVPRDFLGRSTQKTAILLSKLPHWLGDNLGVLVRNLSFGNLETYGLSYPDMPPAAQLRERGKTPVIDIGTVAKIKSGAIRVLPAIEGFSRDEVRFVNGAFYAFDSIILATGYDTAVSEMIDSKGLVNEQGHPRHWNAGEGLYFLGFDAYSNGGLLKSIHDQSDLIVGDIIQTL